MAAPAALLNLLVTANTTPANAALAGTQRQLLRTATSAKKSGLTMNKALAGVGLAAGAAGVALFKIGEEFDKSYDKIRTQTGATGKEMVKLKRSFRDVVKDVPASFDDASQAVGELNTRLGLSGKPLERMSKQMTELSRITETDVSRNIETVSRAFVDWEVAVKDQTKTLDGFFRLSQKSGLAVADIAELVQKFGSPLRQLGFSLDEAAAMFASFERAGVNIQTMVPGLKLAISNLTRPTETLAESMDKLGIKAGNPEKALRQVFDLLTAKGIPAAEKTGLAMDVFGKRAGADMAEAVRQGRFELDKFLKVMRDGDGTIRETGRKTMDLAEHWQKFVNNLKVMVEPIAKDVFKGLGDLMKEVTATFKKQGFEGVLDLLLRKLEEATPKIMAAGSQLAGALVRGFLNAPLWAQILTGAWLLKGIAFKAIGNAIGTRLGQSIGQGMSGGFARFAKVGGPAAIASVIANEFEDMSGPRKAVKDFGNAIEDTFMQALGVSRRAAQQMIQEGNRLGKSFDQLSAEFRQTKQQISGDIQNLSNTWGSSLGEIRQRTQENMRAIKETMGSQSKAGRQAISDNFFAAMQAIKNSMKSGEISAKQGAQAIHRVLVKQLKSYGIKDVDSFLSRQQNATNNATNGGASGLQTGGVIVPGSGSGDKVPAMLEPGEVVLNRNAVAKLGGANRANRINKLIPRFATGGFVDPAGPGTGVVNPAIANTVGAWSQKYNAAINYGYDPGGGHVSPGHNVTGTATDTGPAGGWTGTALALFERGLRFLEGKVPQILYGTAGIGTPYPNHGRGNHAHIEWGMNPNIKGMGGPVGAGGLRLPRFSSDFGLGAAVAAGLNNVAAATESVMGRRLGSVGAGAPGDLGSMGEYRGKLDRIFPATTLASPGAQLTASQVQSVMRPAGLPSVFLGIAQDESGWHPGIIGHDPGGTRGLGLWQITTGFNDDIIRRFGGEANMRNPVVNAQAAKAIFDRQPSAWAASGNALARGGIVQKLAGGGKAKGGGGGTSVTIGGASGTGPSVAFGGATTPAVFKRIRELAKLITELEDQIGVMEAMHAFASSELGSDLGPGEMVAQIAANDQLLAALNEYASKLEKGISKTRPGSQLRQTFVDELAAVKGPPVASSKILAVTGRLDELRNPGTTVGGGIGEELASIRAPLLEQQLLSAQAANALLRSQMPGFHRLFTAGGGGVVPGPTGAAVPAVVHGGEGYFTPEQMAALGGGNEIRIVVEDGAVDPNKIRVEVRDELGRQIRTANRNPIVVGAKTGR